MTRSRSSAQLFKKAWKANHSIVKRASDSSDGSVASGSQQKKTNNPTPDINPLMWKESRKGLCCQLCRKKAYFMCLKCRLVYYCCTEHKHIDMLTFHPLVCEAVSYIAGPRPFMLFKSDRLLQQQKIAFYTKELLDIALRKAKEALLKKEFELAEYRCSYIDRFSRYLFNSNDPNHIQPILISAEALALQGKGEEAKKMLARARLTVAQNDQCSHLLKAEFFRTQGIMESIDGNYCLALQSFAEEVYWASEEFHPEHPRVAAGFFNVGTVILQMGKQMTAISYFNHTIDIWRIRINEVFIEVVEINEVDNLLTSKIEPRLFPEEELLMETSLNFMLDIFLDYTRIITKEQILFLLSSLIQLYYIKGNCGLGLYYVNKASDILVEDESLNLKAFSISEKLTGSIGAATNFGTNAPITNKRSYYGSQVAVKDFEYLRRNFSLQDERRSESENPKSEQSSISSMKSKSGGKIDDTDGSGKSSQKPQETVKVLAFVEGDKGSLSSPSVKRSGLKSSEVLNRGNDYKKLQKETKTRHTTRVDDNQASEVKTVSKVGSFKNLRSKLSDRCLPIIETVTCFAKDLTPFEKTEWREKLKYLRKICRRQLSEST